MEDSGWKRVKHGQEPGDLSKLRKIRLREFNAFAIQRRNINPKHAKVFSDHVKARTKCRLRERTRNMIREVLEDMQKG